MNHEKRGFTLFIAYWFLILLYLPFWLGAVVWSHGAGKRGEIVKA